MELTLNTIATVDKIYDFYIDLYLEELRNLEIGYNFNKSNLCRMRTLLSVIYYLENSDLKSQEVIDIIENII